MKALVNTIELGKNKHIGTNPVSKEIQQELLETMIPMSEYNYWVFRNREFQIAEYE